MRTWLAAALIAGIAAIAWAEAPPPLDDLTKKQLTMLAAESQFFSTLAQQQRDELEKVRGELEKARTNPCPKPG